MRVTRRMVFQLERAQENRRALAGLYLCSLSASDHVHRRRLAAFEALRDLAEPAGLAELRSGG